MIEIIKEPASLSLRISVTKLCQLRCMYCMPGCGNEDNGDFNLLSFDDIMTFINFLKQHYYLSKVHITGGEPLLRPGIVNLIEKLSISGIGDIALTTNGQLLGDMAVSLRHAGLQRVNISLDSLNPENFRRLTGRGELFRTMEGIEAAVKYGFSHVKLNTVVLKNINNILNLLVSPERIYRMHNYLFKH